LLNSKPRAPAAVKVVLDAASDVLGLPILNGPHALRRRPVAMGDWLTPWRGLDGAARISPATSP